MSYKGSRVDKVLTEMSIRYTPTGFICDDVLTPLPVSKWSGLFGRYGDSHLRLHKTRVFDRGEYATVQTVDRSVTDTYVVHNHGIKDMVTERDIEEVELPFHARRDVIQGLRNILKSEKEFSISDLLRKASTYKTGNSMTLSGNAQWSDYGNSDPLNDIKNAKTKVYEQSHTAINVAVIPYTVMETLRFHPKLAGIYGQKGIFATLKNTDIASILQVDKILVPMAAYSNASGTEADFWSKDVVLLHCPNMAAIGQRSFGYALTKRGHNSRVYLKRPDSMVNTEVIFSDTAYNWSIQNNAAGYLLKSVIA